MAGVAAALLASAQLAHAQSTQSIGSITSAANSGTDQSMALLQNVFGSVVTNPLTGGSSSASAIGQIFGTLNACVMVIGALWACYLFFAAMIATGAEGEFMGQKRSSIWFTIRNGVGFTLLVPFTGGYSGAQLLMLWATMMGVGMANLSTSAITGVLAGGGSMVASPVAPQVTSLAKSLYEANLCAVAANTGLQSVSSAGVSLTQDEITQETYAPQTASGKVVLMNGGGSSCGGAQVSLATGSSGNSSSSSTGMTAFSPDTSAITSALSSAQQSALTAMQSTLNSAAQTYVSAVTSGAQPADPQGTINSAAQAYQASIQSAIQSAGGNISSMSSTLSSNLTQNGWSMLGSWYQSFAIANSELSNSAQATATAVGPTDLSDLPYPDVYNNVMAVYNKQLEQDESTNVPAVGSATSSTGVAAGSGTSSWANLMSVSTDPQHILAAIFPGQNIVNYITSTMSTSGTGGTVNPIIGMKNMGDDILAAGWTMFDLYIANAAANGAVSSGLGWVAKQVGGIATGGIATSANAAFQAAVQAAGPVILLLLVSLFFFGVTLSVYLPMLPFMIWFGGLVSWFVTVCEGVVAAPLWAFAHLDGEGEGMGPKTTHGYIFLMNLMLRPTFMVLGFLLATVGITALGMMLNSFFAVAMANAQFDSVTGIVSIIAYIVLYVGMCQSLCQALFGLINHLPNAVFAWLGASMGNTVGHDIHDKAQGHLGGASGTARGHIQTGVMGGKSQGPATPIGNSIGPTSGGPTQG
ncbi:conjugal transfer/type IV secretion protein DotA/TraY [Paraburkholderia silvatlantica]|uniref:Conjugal transfer/type IV secretion protein DotA/TraY n=2 Tax=Paraburkholderia silvatlantica TaxID=321895 RepID=A0A2V4UQ21_9BURK|nr:conjugal transfer/type IV secretion protein DotA/TraY [Paraburkholderia silvatlantica]